MSQQVNGIHHVTAIAGDPQRNIDFYTGLLGLRLVKLTVNYDDPTTYHLYYGNEIGHPGTILTFFPWPDAPRGRIGTGQLTATSFSIPDRSLSYWTERLRQRGLQIEGPTRRFEENVVSLKDPDGLKLELVAGRRGDRRKGWKDGPVPSGHAIRGFYSVTLSEEGYERTSALLTEKLGFRFVEEENNRFRYIMDDGEPGSIVDILCEPDSPRGFVSVGTVHHVAWRTPTEQHQKRLREEIAGDGFNVTPVIDRTYFRSVYFREPGGVLFEIATDAPGFTVNEKPRELGTSLVLPAWLESQRDMIVSILPKIRVPAAVSLPSQQ